LESIIKINIGKIINKASSEMSRIICTLIICYVAVTYYPLDGFRPVHNCNQCYGTIEKHTVGSASSGHGRPAESGKDSVGAGDRTASGDGQSETPDGLP
jgi:hypothetical protein